MSKQLDLCMVCTKRAFNPNKGTVCGLTSEKPTFEIHCNEYEEDPKAVHLENVTKNESKKATNKAINKGRIALFIIGGLYVILGAIEGFVMPGHDILYGAIDWVIAGLFIGLAVLSYQHAYLSLLIGFCLYIGLMLLFAFIDPSTVFKGIIWKGLIIYYLIISIKTARENQHQEEVFSEDLLDQA